MCARHVCMAKTHNIYIYLFVWRVLYTHRWGKTGRDHVRDSAKYCLVVGTAAAATAVCFRAVVVCKILAFGFASVLFVRSLGGNEQRLYVSVSVYFFRLCPLVGSYSIQIGNVRVDEKTNYCKHELFVRSKNYLNSFRCIRDFLKAPTIFEEKIRRNAKEIYAMFLLFDCLPFFPILLSIHFDFCFSKEYFFFVGLSTWALSP